ncbi:acyltransferase family protein [Aquibacillus albus]|uniref:Fucose 4-O-acetylase-like acetyltransferase n=1 Tax=Aquibacillus albus TaxID=1168171 RepID=A0ABS2MXL0_9BACI|nr:acyltransferase family protein [Aquibacillus albus]MBM7570518.1 fucose 4-O-acetylase-like acetyltransferase [Aquibacillus albus]
MKREAFIDNAKVVLIFFVVFGHVIQPFTSQLSSIQLLYFWIYIFHMPAFIFLSGFFAKGLGNKGYIFKLAKRLLFPYFVFQLFYTGYYFTLGMDNWETTIFRPQWSLWFLLSLFCWHLMLVIFKRFPPIVGIILAIEIGIVAGHINQIGYTMSLSRTLVFFPFFLLGYWITKEQLLFVKGKVVKSVSLIVMAGVAAILWVIPEFSTYWLLGTQPYNNLGAPGVGGLVRLGVYVLAIMMAISILAWIPRKRNRFTHLGQKTLFIYLLHGIFIQFFRETEILKINHPIDVVGLAVISCLIVLILGSKPVVTVTQPLIEGRINRIAEIVRERSKKHEEIN